MAINPGTGTGLYGLQSNGITVMLRDDDVSQSVMWAKGDTVPTDTDAGYAKGCIFIKTDGSTGTTLYVNEGSSTSCDFNAK